MLNKQKRHCEWCGKLSDTKFCSMRCHDIVMRIRQSRLEQEIYNDLTPFEPAKHIKSYDEYVAIARKQSPSPYLAPYSARPPQSRKIKRNDDTDMVD